MSFAPLAGRLAAHAAELRPVEGSRDNLAKFAALVLCALLDMLILVCELLDARTSAEARPTAVAVLAQRTASPSRPSTSTLSLVPMVRAVASRGVEFQSRTVGVTLSGPWLAWSRDAGPIRIFSLPMAAPSENEVFHPASRHALFVTIP